MPPGVERMLSIWTQPTAVVAIVVFVISNTVFTLWWARGESARITANEQAVTSLRADVFNMNTPLSAKLLQFEAQQAVIHQQVTRELTQLDRLVERMIDVQSNTAAIKVQILAIEKRLDDFRREPQ